MNDSINLLNDLYQNAEMGIIGIDDVLCKVKNNKLNKELLNEKNEYQNLLNECKKCLKKEKCSPKKIGMLAKVSSTVYSEIKLMKENNDEAIVKMMIEGTYKSIGILTTKESEYSKCNINTKKILMKFIKTLNNNINNLKKLDY